MNTETSSFSGNKSTNAGLRWNLTMAFIAFFVTVGFVTGVRAYAGFPDGIIAALMDSLLIALFGVTLLTIEQHLLGSLTRSPKESRPHLYPLLFALQVPGLIAIPLFGIGVLAGFGFESYAAGLNLTGELEVLFKILCFGTLMIAASWFVFIKDLSKAVRKAEANTLALHADQKN